MIPKNVFLCNIDDAQCSIIFGCKKLSPFSKKSFVCTLLCLLVLSVVLRPHQNNKKINLKLVLIHTQTSTIDGTKKRKKNGQNWNCFRDKHKLRGSKRCKCMSRNDPFTAKTSLFCLLLSFPSNDLCYFFLSSPRWIIIVISLSVPPSLFAAAFTHLNDVQRYKSLQGFFFVSFC